MPANVSVFQRNYRRFWGIRGAASRVWARQIWIQWNKGYFCWKFWETLVKLLTTVWSHQPDDGSHIGPPVHSTTAGSFSTPSSESLMHATSKWSNMWPWVWLLFIISDLREILQNGASVTILHLPVRLEKCLQSVEAPKTDPLKQDSEDGVDVRRNAYRNVKFTPEQAKRVQKGSRCIVLLFL